ncbi:hypothetical protein [Enemella sp. A6]|uniref:hypothetical protein n=1 Tax=Enemella sp. A6 TaxID=3440152 RepID=UPI003EBBD96F
MTHPSRDVLADVAADLAVDRVARAHVASCARCTEIVAVFTEAGSLLSDVPAETMPPDVAARLDATLDAEVARRRSGASKAEMDAESAAAAARTALGSFGANPIGEKKIAPQRRTRLSN